MKMLIGGQKVASSSGEEIRVINPATQELIDTIPSATEKDVDRRFQCTTRQKEWSCAHIQTSSILKNVPKPF